MNIVERKVKKTIGECDVCATPDIEVAVYYGGIAQCDSCYQAELELLANTSANRTLVQSAKIDETNEVSQDMYNKGTVSCVELQGAIQADDNIQNKQYALAEVVIKRITDFDAAIFKKQQELADLNSVRRAHVTFLKDSAFVNQLRNDEREKLKLADLSYIPTSPKTATIRKAASNTSPSAKSVKSAEIRALATKLGIAESLHSDFINGVSLMMKVRKLALEDAGNIIAQGMK